MNFLAPDGYVVASLREKGLYKGIVGTTIYQDLGEEPYRTEWRINLIIYESNRHVSPRDSQSPQGVLPVQKRILEETTAANRIDREGPGPRRAVEFA
jgi:hypothetical protein